MFRIEISELFEKTESSYGTSVTIYAQTIDAIDIPAIVSVVNKIKGE